MDVSDISGSAFFKPADYLDAVAILVEPILVEEDVRNEYNGVVNVRDEVTADLMIWSSLADFANDTPVVLKRVKLTHSGLTRIAKKAVGGATIARVEEYTTKYRSTGFRLAKPDAEAYRLAVEAFEHRRSQIEAVAASAPPF
jgi:hypothetical protein